VLQQVVDIKLWLTVDADTQYAARLERDRQIGSEMEAKADVERVLAWWHKIAQDSPSQMGGRVASFRAVATLALFGIGGVLGLSIAGVAFAFNGSHPVNLFALFGVLVGLPLLFFITSVLVLLVPIPGMSKVSRQFSALSPGRWVGVWLDKAIDAPVFFVSSGSPGELSFSRWQMIRFGQWFSVGYFVGVLVLAWLLVVFTDLAFGWSTTLNVQPASVHAWFHFLTIPWRDWLPIAVPTLDLVEASRFFRLEASVPLERAMQLGGWWPFVMMVIVVYGLVPRVAFLLYANFRVRKATKELLLKNPEVTALLDRLKAPAVSFDPLTSNESDLENETTSGPTSASLAGLEGRLRIVIWNQALGSNEALRWLNNHWQCKISDPIHISLIQSAEQQASLLAEITKDVDSMVIFVKGWEPPTLDFQDLLQEARKRLSDKATIMIVPINTKLEGVTKVDRDIWAVTLGSRFPGSYVLGEFP